MNPHAFRRRSRLSLSPLILALGVVAWTCLLRAPAMAAPPEPETSGALLKPGDRVAWIGSSSTRIGVWTGTAEFLLQTRHPELDLKFQRFTTGGGTFATGLEHLDEWLSEFDPTVVVFNYGGNDAGAGRKGLAQFHKNMDDCIEKVQDSGARVILVTPQAADVRRSGAQPAANRTLYAESMLSLGRQRGLTVIDVHHPLDLLQRAGEQADADYTILKDKIHLTNPAYVAWGYFFYDALNLPLVRSEAVLSADGEVLATENCEIANVNSGENSIAFTRLDQVLPILPPGPLPPRLYVPLESHSLYRLSVTGFESGAYEIRCEGQILGVADADALGVGVNLNALLLESGKPAPWDDLAQSVWEGKDLNLIGKTRWKFEIRKR